MTGWIEDSLRQNIDALVARWRRHRRAAVRAARGERISEALSGLDERLLDDLGVTRTGGSLPDAEAPPPRRQARTGLPIIKASSRKMASGFREKTMQNQ